MDLKQCTIASSSKLISNNYNILYRTLEKRKADIWLVMTCSIREGAEAKVWNALQTIKSKSKSGIYNKSLKVGLLGCMAERLKDKMLDTSLVDIVAGPDSYRLWNVNIEFKISFWVHLHSVLLRDWEKE